MSGALFHFSQLLGYTGLGIIWANEMDCVMSHAPGAGSIARPVVWHAIAIPQMTPYE